MNNLLEQQYLLIKEARKVIFSYLQDEVGKDINQNLKTFNNKSIADMMVHIANTYVAWAGNFALGTDQPYYTEKDGSHITSLKALFTGVDLIMNSFINKFAQDPMTPVKGFKWPEKYIETNAFGIFTHVLTHEFHHKGQVMTMSRLLGYTPPDTDILRF